MTNNLSNKIIDAKRPHDTQDFGEALTYYFTTRDGAWAFKAAADEAGFKAGFPSLGANKDGHWTVQTIRGGY